MQLELLIDRMIDQARESDPEGDYGILVGIRPATERDWLAGRTAYRSYPIVQTKYVPNYVVVLAPSPQGVQGADLFEYHGRILNGDVTRHTVRRARGESRFGT